MERLHIPWNDSPFYGLIHFFDPRHTPEIQGEFQMLASVAELEATKPPRREEYSTSFIDTDKLNTILPGTAS
ncbi:MAG: hypothetical protein JEZ03_15220 [Bacteroidales bacterium]|nr:hypothetical protein [Bacteroidales bacterium]